MRYDERFSGGLTYCWMNTDVQAATEDYGVDFTDTGNWYDSEKGREMDLNILNPILNGRYVRLSIQETTVPNPYQEKNVETTCKTRGKGGEPITSKGNYVWRNVIAVSVPTTESVVKHTLLEADPVEVKLEEQVEITTESMVGEVESNEIGL